MIKPPRWSPDATPTSRGWEYNGELLTCRRHTQEEIDEYMNDFNPKPMTLTESPVSESEFFFEHMDKAQLKAFGEANGVSLDGRMSVHNMVQTLKESIPH